MRFLIKRPHMKEISKELEVVMDVLMSDFFIMFDLFWFSVIFTILLFPIFPSIVSAILFFASSYGFFSFIYFIVFKDRSAKKG